MGEEIFKLLCITGSGRNGSLSMRTMLRHELSLKIGHEYVDEDGTASMYFFDRQLKDYPRIKNRPPKDKNAHAGQRMKDFKFKNIWHQVRHPYKAIASIAVNCPAATMDWFVKQGVIPDVDTRLHKAMFIWDQVSARADKICSYRFRIEDVNKEWANLCNKLDYKDSPPLEIVQHKGKNVRTMHKIDIYKLKDQDIALAKTIQQRAKKYGYYV